MFSGLFGSSTPIKRTRIHNFIVSTVDIPDKGYETAILGDDVVPVKRYLSYESAIGGHDEICNMIYESGNNSMYMAKIGGWNGLVEDKEVVIHPFEDGQYKDDKDEDYVGE